MSLHTAARCNECPLLYVTDPLVRRYLDSPQARMDVILDALPVAERLRFDAASALALSRAHDKLRAARRVLVLLGRYDDAVAAAPTLDAAAEVAEVAPRPRRHALWLQVLRTSLRAARGGSDVEDALDAVLARSRGEVRLDEALRALPRARGTVTQAARLMRRCAVAESARLAEADRGFSGLGDRTEGRRVALREMQAARARAAGGAAAGVREGKCGVCGRLLAGAPGKAVPHGERPAPAKIWSSRRR